MRHADFVAGMWKRRFEKQDAKAAKARELAEKAQQEPKSGMEAVIAKTVVRNEMEKACGGLDTETKARKEKIMARFSALGA
jgi:hypothetical protein